MRPLDRLGSIKIKLGVVIVVSLIVSVAVVLYGWRTGIRPRFLLVFTGLLALGVIQFLAHGMTKPLREMASAAQRMSNGDYSVRVTATSRDEVGDLANAFNSMAGRIADLDNERRAFVANVSHELQSPLTAVRARLENMVDGVEPIDPDAMASMLRSVDRLGRLVDQLLDLSRLESGQPLAHQQFVARDVVDAAVDEARLASDGALIDVTIRAAAHIVGDPDRIHQVVANLLDNAIRHAPNGSRVTVDVDVSAAGTSIAVTDAGPGIPDEVASRIFDRFYGAPEANGTRRGAGLGLAIARSIVDLHGGTIRAESVRPTGCRMVVQFPPDTTRKASS